MKKLALILMSISASIFGLSAVAQAYPLGGDDVVKTVSTTRSGATFTAEITCSAESNADLNAIVQALFRESFRNASGELVKLLNRNPIADAPCTTSTGTASFLVSAPTVRTATLQITAPDEPGTYTVDYSGAATGSFSFTVTGTATPATPGGGLPATGSNGTGTMTLIAVGLFAVGAGLFGVSQVRRRDNFAV